MSLDGSLGIEPDSHQGLAIGYMRYSVMAPADRTLYSTSPALTGPSIPELLKTPYGPDAVGKTESI